MNSLDVLGLCLDGFGWGIVLVACAVGIAFLYRNELVHMLEAKISYDDLELDEIVEIEDARAELARLTRERAEKARQSAHISRMDAFATFALYVPAWEGKWQDEAISRISEKSVGDLTALSGIGERRARRIIDAGDGLSLDKLQKICTLPVATHVLRSV